MKASTQHQLKDNIYRLRQQINLEENRGKLQVLVSRLQIALKEEQKTPGKIHAQRAENPFDAVIVG